MTNVTNKNMFSPVGFQFSLQRSPETNFFVQSVILPGIQLGTVETPSPMIRIPQTGDHVTYGDLTVTFKVDEDMVNYRTLFDWITGLGFPDEFGQYKTLDDQPSYSGLGPLSDATLLMMTSAMNANIKIDFTDVFPTGLTDITMDARDTQIEYVEATCNFRFLNYKFTKIG